MNTVSDKNAPPSEITGVILCGGRGTRLGGPKESLDFGGPTLIEYVVSRIRPLFSRILLAGLPPETAAPPGAAPVPDEIPGAGPLGGIYSGLLRCETEYGFVFACDAPFVSLSLARHIMSLAPGADIVVPEHGSHYHPLFGIYARSCLPVIREHLDNRIFKISEIYPRLRLRTIDETTQRRHDPDLQCFFNINTRDDYLRALSMLENPPRRT